MTHLLCNCSGAVMNAMLEFNFILYTVTERTLFL